MKRVSALYAIKRDLNAVVLHDPATKSKLVAALCSSGFHALVMYRLFRFFYVHRYFLVARLLSALTRLFTGIEIHPGAKIGSGVFIDHGMGVVIGETAVVGDNVVIYQGVTLGGTGKDTGKRHPTVEDDVMISSGAKILGPFTIGRGAKIGAGAVVLNEVPPYATVVGIPARVVRVRGKRVIQNVDCAGQRSTAQDNNSETRICALEHKLNKILSQQNTAVTEYRVYMDKLKFYNTLSRQKEEFSPIAPPTVTTYSCGPTVYNYAHIGNLRTYVFMDELRRTLKYAGYTTKSVMNITDVGHLMSDGDDGEDKMTSAAKKQNKSPGEIAAFYSEVFFKDLNRLNILLPEIIAKATDNIPEMIDFVKVLCDKGYGYETDDGIYFDISKFDEYGKLSRCNIDDALAGARVAVNMQKRHPADFALWKKAEKNHIMQWESPWGMGYPGWHIECSTMSKKFLGDRFDIHTGGVDHIPIHHENEIAQSEALEEHKVVNLWMHGEFMLVDGGKMSKSLGNVYTIDDLIKKGFSPLAFRYFCLNTHYRNKLNFTFDGLSGAATAYNRLRSIVSACKSAQKADADTAKKVQAQKTAIIAAVYDDLNYPLALGELWTMVKTPCREVYDAAVDLDRIFGLDLHLPPEKTDSDIPDNIKALAEKRFAARKAKDWATSDAIRNELDALGYTVLDAKDGYELRIKN